MPLRDPAEFRALVQALGLPAAAATLRHDPGDLPALADARGGPPLWALVLLRRALHDRLDPPPGLAPRPSTSSPAAPAFASLQPA